MKQLSLALNAVLLVAVGILYYLHFKGTPASASVADVPAAVTVKPSTIVFVNSDTLNEHYEFIKARKTDLEAQHKRITQELEGEGQKIQADYERYKQQGATMTDEQRMATETDLMRRQQALEQKGKSMMSKLDDQQDKINEQLYDNLNSFLKDLNAKRKYDFILAYQKGINILMANDSLDITKTVLEGLNKKYEEETSAKK